MRGRDAKRAVKDAINSGNLVIKQIKDGKEISVKSKPVYCSICNKKIGDCLEDYAYLIINDDNFVDVVEKDFCTKKCWQRFLTEEAERIKEVVKE